ncbi:MAG: response regulator transcription factor [Deltaproteobacteria bacterium]|nr:response regulator transcription factor [Candidatus Tharpella aukensis]
MMATIFIIDDDPFIRKVLSRLISAGGIKSEAYGTAREFLDSRRYDVHGCILLDVEMPGLSGPELQEELAKKGCSMPIIFISGQADVPIAAKAMKKGAVDFLTKPIDRDHLLYAINESLKKDYANRKVLDSQAKISQKLATLTPRQYEIMTFVISGKLNKQIAYELGIVEDTVKIHRHRMMVKMDCTSVAELVRLTETSGVNPA